MGAIEIKLSGAKTARLSLKKLGDFFHFSHLGRFPHVFGNLANTLSL